MAIAVPATRQALANQYASLGNWIGVTVGDPGTSGTPAGEPVGGTPPYARQQTTWTAGSGGNETGSQVTINVPPGNYDHIFVASSASGATMIDKATIPTQGVSTQGQLLVTPAFQQA